MFSLSVWEILTGFPSSLMPYLKFSGIDFPKVILSLLSTLHELIIGVK